MRNILLTALAVSAAAIPASAPAQTAVAAVPVLAGTRLDISATGEVTRVPDMAIISAGVQTLRPTATAAIEQNAAQMEQVRAALKRAGIEDRDIQTSSINLNPEYQYDQNQPPRLTGYRASNTLNVKFRDLKRTGAILDALVAQGANSISGPNLTIDKPESALDEARAKAIVNGRARADLYARALGMRVVRLLSVSESGGYAPPPPMPMVMMAQERGAGADTKIDPGTQQVQVSVSMSFELQ
ncbi:SIMPL domain-containing protein [Sphingomonas sp. RB56-2]|uniref:SIMPL domain-containing protein n=1 Tax=Sphingomonas brevis TaxID=2908206 RepID=A0ABT0S9R5_9SPHN|nr:SIMPL domain-containing protein [Sphingomonas brevis]MCL6741122.1 SIMPL domain-containing protein [Sphingomonas brevis]